MPLPLRSLNTAPEIVPPAALTNVFSMSALFPGVGSVTLLATLAVFIIVPEIVTLVVTTIVMVAELPLLRLVRLQVTAPPASPQGPPWLGVAETKVTLMGRVSVTMTFAASDGP